MAFCTFFPILLVGSNVFPIPVLYFTYLVLVLVSLYRLCSAQVLPPFFSDTSYLSAFIKKGIKILMAMGNTHLACAVKLPCGAVVSSQVGRAVPPTCAALAAAYSTGCPERRLANKQLGKSLQLLVPLPSLRTAIKCFCSGSADLEASFQAAPFLSSFGTISHTIIFLSHLQEEQSAWTCSQYHSPPQS